MLAQLRKVFLNAHEDSSDALSSELQNPSFVTDPSKIASLLQQIIEAPPLCSVTAPNSTKVYFTSILEIQPEKKLLLFDRLTPAIDSRLSNKLDTLKLSTYINGVQLTFQLQDIVQENSCHPPIYKARLPVSIYYPQRRSSPESRPILMPSASRAYPEIQAYCLKETYWIFRGQGSALPYPSVEIRFLAAIN